MTLSGPLCWLQIDNKPVNTCKTVNKKAVGSVNNQTSKEVEGYLFIWGRFDGHVAYYSTLPSSKRTL